MHKVAEVLLKNIMRLMADRQLSQASLAKAANLAQPQLSTYLNGKNVPHLDRIEDLARALSVEPWELLKEGPKSSPPVMTITRALNQIEDAHKLIIEAHAFLKTSISVASKEKVVSEAPSFYESLQNIVRDPKRLNELMAQIQSLKAQKKKSKL